MEIRFLGTSSGTPTKDRNVSAVAIVESKGRNWYLIDCGEGTQHQLLRSNLSLNSLGAVLITHVHGDHCYGLPGLLGSAGMTGRRSPLVIVAPKGIKGWLEATIVETQLHLPFELNFISTESVIDLALSQFLVSTVELSHRVPSFAYIFREARVEKNLDTEKLKLTGLPQGPLWGKLRSGVDVEHEGQLYESSDYLKNNKRPRKLIVCGDNDNPELLSHECMDCDVLIHEATYTEDMASKANEVGHSYAKRVASFAQKHAIPYLILTHFSPRYQSSPNASPSIQDIQNEATKSYLGQLHLAEDFQQYRIDSLGQLTQVEH